ncbi:GLPGLI family protein [Riemerella columbina]|uniref:GLPGLI family protein n=1 Tax=Riemerella columbina TaxID=103810 RepID=UPI002481814E|nr:GLPGLI family protein [Riemerella columbina]
MFYGSVGSSLLSYHDSKINNWKLIDETKTINSFVCNKAEVHFRGRDWVAWYSTEIPFPYGPYKFGGLPGLIIKITDTKGDYDFKLVKSVANKDLKGKTITVDPKRYKNSTLVTQQELLTAKDNFRKNLLNSMQKDGVILSQEQMDNFRKKQKLNEQEKKGYNPIELEE